jgi:hypothetical protein
VKARRAVWFDQFQNVTLNQLVFIDEFGAASNMTRLYARGPVGRRIVCRSPHGHWKVLEHFQKIIPYVFPQMDRTISGESKKLLSPWSTRAASSSCVLQWWLLNHQVFSTSHTLSIGL